MIQRILFLTPQLPYPPYQGTAIRNFGLIRGLAERGYTVSLLSFVEPDQPPASETPLADLCTSIATVPAPERTRGQRMRDLLAGYADMARRRWSETFLAALRGWLERETFDAIHIEGIEMAPYLPVLRAGAPGALLIYDAHNAEYALQRRIAAQDIRLPKRWPAAIYSLLQSSRLTQLETEVCRQVGYVLACSEADARMLQALPHHTPVSVVPNGINSESYTEDNLAEACLPRPAVVFTGKMDFRPNVDAVLWFAKDILPRIRAEMPTVHFTVVGQKPHARLSALRGRGDVTLTGFVPDVRPYIATADVYVAPLRMGSGTRLKLLEAMAMRRAIVSTRLGAEGLPVDNRVHLLLADMPSEFAEAVLRLLRDPAQRQELGENAARLVRQHYDWKAIIPTLEQVYQGG
jgi:sugar transferase (PEP-CTERM/EpsH1 system associated)